MSPSRIRISLFTAAMAVVFLSVLWLSSLTGSSSIDAEILDIVSTSDGWADESSCIQCHTQAETFSETGHANTLRPASSPASQALLEQLVSSDAARHEETKIIQRDGAPTAVTRSNDIQHELKLDWCFGSGTHACTWASTIPDSHGNTDVLEFRFTWFASQHGFELTPGQPETKGGSPVSALGLLFDGARARRCFSCHATVLPVAHGRLDESRIKPGVTCQRCHGPREKHVQSEGEFHPPAWGATDRMEAVNRCAVCHRLPEEKTVEEIVMGNPDIVRFQPMGLTQSPCFLSSKMRCTTCHDPHKKMAEQNSTGIWQCVQCHDPETDNHTLCGMGRRDDCLTCHMPKVDVGFPVKFTDHWIRIRSPDGEVER